MSKFESILLQNPVENQPLTIIILKSVKNENQTPIF